MLNRFCEINIVKTNFLVSLCAFLSCLFKLLVVTPLAPTNEGIISVFTNVFR